MDDPRHPTHSAGLVPDTEDEASIDRLTSDTPDRFGEPMDDENLENELPEEGVYPGDTEFEQDMEDDEIDRYGEPT